MIKRINHGLHVSRYLYHSVLSMLVDRMLAWRPRQEHMGGK
jgi:hypothetical protein